MISVLIADDHAIVRKGLIQVVSGAMDLRVDGEASDSFEAMEMARKHPYDVIVLDMSMPGPSGIDVIKQLKSEHPNTQVLVLSMHAEDQYGVRVLRAGASGYLTKESAPAELVKAIRRVANGQKYFSMVVAEALLNHLDGNTTGPLHVRLSDREFEVMMLLAQGGSIKDIADKLALSAKTISTYRARILEKMNVGSNAEIAQYAIRNGLIE